MNFLRSARLLLAFLLLPLLAVPSSFAWGSKGHKMINRLAVESLPADMPTFMRTPEAINEIEYLGPEPDRWRSRAEPELSAEQAPDHFIDLELADVIGPLPRRRYDFIAALYAYAAAHPAQAADERPEKVGFQPYITEEVWQRLKSAMRDYRELSAQKADTKPVEAAILFYAGWLGHYVGDGSMPLHTTIQYNGWVGPNPNGYTTAHTIHSQFESAFVDAEVNPSDVQPLLSPGKPIGDEWDDYLAYLRHTNTLVEKVYQLDKDHGFDGAGTPEAKAFTAERLAAAASMLRDLYVAAWVKSADPVPEWHEHAEAAPATTPPATSTSADRVFGMPRPAGFTSPILIFNPNPHFSKRSGTQNPSGFVIIGFIVDKSGNPVSVHIVKGLGNNLDQKAVKDVQSYRFKPATYQGQIVAAEVQMQVNADDSEK
ncbi:MAG TPA: TonB family protein [Acidobacteriaceae bacterium]|jgi:TonB family protein|nr:TonB family protein [Acidobacteriaceae bacterium]